MSWIADIEELSLLEGLTKYKLKGRRIQNGLASSQLSFQAIQHLPRPNYFDYHGLKTFISSRRCFSQLNSSLRLYFLV